MGRVFEMKLWPRKIRIDEWLDANTCTQNKKTKKCQLCWDCLHSKIQNKQNVIPKDISFIINYLDQKQTKRTNQISGEQTENYMSLIRCMLRLIYNNKKSYPNWQWAAWFYQQIDCTPSLSCSSSVSVPSLYSCSLSDSAHGSMSTKQMSSWSE